RTVIDRLIVKKENVKVIIYTNQQTNKIRESDLIMFNKQYGLLEIINTNKVHDRYIIIDKDKLYHLGHSIKDIGKKISMISESDKNLINELLREI
ncbi:MAG: ORF6N domain-containing protein, partial [Bacilli bacterium]|nr:ORF6N domain-containing protein [Bacilli bacterium]